MFEFTPVSLDKLDEAEFNGFSDKLIYQTTQWIQFIRETQKATPLILRITDTNGFIGYFTCLIFSKFGIRIAGSPFNGWTTQYMGFNIRDDIKIDRCSLILPLWEYLKREQKIAFCQIIDRYITVESAMNNNLDFSVSKELILDIDANDETLLSSYTKHCREHIRSFERKPCTIECVEPNEEYAEAFYNQLSSVFGYQGLTPSYNAERIKALISNLKSTGRICCTRVIENETGKWISSIISLGFNDHAYTFASTSLRENRDYHQSEGQRWFAIKYWRDKGCKDLDMVGMREYKMKFNPTVIEVPHIVMYRSKSLLLAKNFAQKMYWKINSIKNKIRGMVEKK